MQAKATEKLVNEHGHGTLTSELKTARKHISLDILSNPSLRKLLF